MIAATLTPHRPEYSAQPTLLPRAGLFSPTPTYTSAVPLLTAFTAPSNCFGQSYTLSPNGLDSLTSISFASVWQGVTSSCYPPSFSLIDSRQQTGLAPYYSPGVCPYGWTTVGYISGTDQNIATCCPVLTVSDFLYDVDPTQTQPMQYIDGACGAHDNALEMTVFGTQFTSGLTRISAFEVHVSAVTVAWQDNDLTTMTAAVESIAQSSTTTSPSAEGTGSSNADRPSSLSTAAKAGIGAGAAILGLLILLTAAVVLYRRRAGQRTETPHEVDASQSTPFGKAELSGEDTAASWTTSKATTSPAAAAAAEAADTPVHEAPADGRTEVPADALRHELESGWQGWEAQGSPLQERGDAKHLDLPS